MQANKNMCISKTCQMALFSSGVADLPRYVKGSPKSLSNRLRRCTVQSYQ